MDNLIGTVDDQPTITRWIVTHFTRTAMPPLRIPDFHMSTVSDAT